MNTATRVDSHAGSTALPAALKGPIDPNARATVLDALRGFALIGVCLGNIATSFSFWDQPGTEAFTPKYLLPTDGTAQYLFHALVDGKFYSLFSLLFGLGFALQLGRRSDDGAALVTYRRRLKVLAVIGFAHILIWMGDILFFYALMGMILVRLRGMDDRRLLRWVVILLALPIVNYLPTLVHPALMIGTPFFAAAFGIATALGLDVTQPAIIAESYVQGGVAEMAKLSVPAVFFRLGDLLLQGRPFKVLAMFLLGMLVGRRRMWEDLDAHVTLLRRICLWGVVIGLPACLVLAMNAVAPGAQGSAGLAGLRDTVLYSIGVAPLALAYGAAFVLLWRIPAWQRVLIWLAPTGRMALTNYLMQTLIGIGVFYGIGLGLGGRLGATYFLPLGLAILAGQTLFSRWWLARHQFGPMEGVWRKWTYR